MHIYVYVLMHTYIFLCILKKIIHVSIHILPIYYAISDYLILYCFILFHIISCVHVIICSYINADSEGATVCLQGPAGTGDMGIYIIYKYSYI